MPRLHLVTTDDPPPSSPADRAAGRSTPSGSEPSWLDPERTLYLDPQSLRALAHPVRLRMLGVLRTEGPSTATRLAHQLGLNSGATSYHLRQLAQYGLIRPDEERGTGRERWWRAGHRTTWFELSEAPEEDKDAGAAYLQSIALVYAERMQRAAEESSTLPLAWQRAATFSDFSLQLDPTEAKQLMDELMAVAARYRAQDPDQPTPPGTQPYHVQLQAFLRPGHLPSEQPGRSGDTTDAPAEQDDTEPCAEDRW